MAGSRYQAPKEYGAIEWLRAHRVELGPGYAALIVLLLGVVTTMLLAIQALLLIAVAALGCAFWVGRAQGWRRPYYTVVSVVACGWIGAATFATGGLLTWRWLLVAWFCATILLAIPWWSDNVRRTQVRMENIIRTWSIRSARISLQGTAITGMKGSATGWSALLSWLPGAYTTEVVSQRKTELEGALGLNAGELRLAPDGRSTNSVRLVAVTNDPHVAAIPWEIPTVTVNGQLVLKRSRARDQIALGLREDSVIKKVALWIDGWGAKQVLGAGIKGCLAADTEVIINRAGNGARRSIKDLYERFNGIGVKGNSRWRDDIPTMIQREVNGVCRLGRVRAVWESGVKTTYTLTTDAGRTIRATAEHPFATARGWVKLGDLELGDEVRVRGAQAVGQPRAPKRLYRQVGRLWQHPHHSALHGQVALHRLTAEAALNGTSLLEHEGRIRSGDTTGIQWLDPAAHVHHIDHDHRNNELSNLRVMSPGDHDREHDRADQVLYKIVTERVASITEHAPEMTYDIAVDDEPHNFLANGFVVHNSGKSNLFNLFWGKFALDTDVVQWGIDLKGGMELGPWRGVFDWVVYTREQAVLMLKAAEAVIDARAVYCREVLKKKAWIATPDTPVLVITIDEAATLLGNARSSELHTVEELARKGRAVGVIILIATQYPTLDALGSSQLRQQIDQRFCFRMADSTGERYVLPEYTVDAHKIPADRPGTCYHLDADKLDSMPFRTYFMDEPTIEQLVSLLTGYTCGLDAVSARAASAPIIVDDERVSTGYAERDIPVPLDRDGNENATETTETEGETTVTGIPEWNENDEVDLDAVTRDRDAHLTEEQRATLKRARDAEEVEPARLDEEAAYAALLAALKDAGPAGTTPRVLMTAATRKSSWFYEKMGALDEAGTAKRTKTGTWAWCGQVAHSA